MKKLLVAACVVCAALISQAARVSWTSGTFSGGFSGPDGLTMKGATTYIMTVSVYSDLAGTTLVTSSTDDAPNNGGAFTGSIADLTADTDYYVKAIITGTDSANKTWTREAALSAIHTPVQGTPTIGFHDGSNFVVTGAKWGQWTSSAAPEPTSGIMLLLGVGLMALRRRRA